MSITLTIQNYRGLRDISCTVPSGVSIVVGPNGAGKTTLLKVPELFRHAFNRGWSPAVEQHGGLHGYKSVLAEPGELVRLRLERSELTWEVDFNGSVEGTVSPSEDLHLAGQRVGRRDDGGTVWGADGLRLLSGTEYSIARLLVDREKLPVSSMAAVPDMRCYSDFFSYRLRTSGSENSADTHLHPTGLNVLTVLRNWKDKLATRSRQEFVMDVMREAFPGFVDLEFEVTSNVVDALVVARSRGVLHTTKLRNQANGFIHGLMCLTGVASTPPGGLVTLDELETALHPYAIRRVLEGIRRWSSEQEIDVVLSTHSPVVIDAMNGEPEQVLVFTSGDEEGLRPLCYLHDRAMLERFSVGDMYSQLRVGAPDLGKVSTGLP